MRSRPPKLHWDGSRPAVENARKKLPELARGFFAAGRGAAEENVSLEAVHRFRLFAKRFRYTLEMFGPYYGPGLERRIEALQDLQTLLGAVSDCSSTRELILERDDLSEAARARLLAGLKQKAGVRLTRFRRHWQDDFSGPAHERWWTGYLAGFARDRKSKAKVKRQKAKVKSASAATGVRLSRSRTRLRGNTFAF